MLKCKLVTAEEQLVEKPHNPIKLKSTEWVEVDISNKDDKTQASIQ